MTVLVTGGAGYSLSHMVHAPVDAGQRVVSTVCRPASTERLHRRRRSRSVIAVITSRVAALIVQHGVDAIIHFAASIVVPGSVAIRSATPAQHGKFPRAHRKHGQSWGAPSFRPHGWQSRARAGAQGPPAVATSLYGFSQLMTETMLRDAFAGRHQYRRCSHGIEPVQLAKEPPRTRWPVTPSSDLSPDTWN
jgi:UDP-glucose 4-epimerase